MQTNCRPRCLFVISHIACTWRSSGKSFQSQKKTAFEARLRDGRPKFRNAAKKVFKAKQNKQTRRPKNKKKQREEVTAVIC